MVGETLLYILLFIIVIGIVAYWIHLERSFKYRAIIKDIVHGRKIVNIHKASHYVDNDKVTWWKLAGEKDKNRRLLPLPPEDAIELDKKGRKVAQCLRTETDEIIWQKENTDLHISEKEVKAGEALEGYEPFTTKQRIITMNLIRKAESRRNKKDLMTAMIQLGSLAVLGMVIVAGMVFWGDLAQPALNANNQAAAGQANQIQILEIMRDIKTGQQTIGDRITTIENQPPD